MIPRPDQYPDDWKNWDFDHELTGISHSSNDLYSTCSMILLIRSEFAPGEISQSGHV